MKPLIALLALSPAAFFSAPSRGEAVSLPNPSFEKATASRADAPEGWVKQPADAKGAWDEGQAHEGRSSVRIDASGPAGARWQTEDRQPVQDGQRVAFHGWVKLQGAYGDNELSILWFDADGKWLSASRSPKQNGTCDWREVSVEAAVPPGAKSARFAVGRRFGTDQGTSWFDDLSVTVRGSADGDPARAEAAPPTWEDAGSPLQEGRDTPPATATNGNLLPNGNLESGTGAAPAGWSRLGEALGDGRWEPGGGGIRSLSITDTLAAHVGWRSDPVPLDGLRQVTLAARILVRQAHHVRLGLEWLDPARSSLGVTLSRGMEGDAPWGWDWIVARVPASARYARVVVTQDRSSGSSYFGGFSLVSSSP